MGLKSNCENKYSKPVFVKIRPKWDWNKNARKPPIFTTVLKSDQNGIEIKLNMSHLYILDMLKSDQNGIEIAIQWLLLEYGES